MTAKRTWIELLTVVAIAALASPAPARAVLIANESFTSTGPLNGQSGGVGWNGGWVTGQPAVFQVGAAGLPGGLRQPAPGQIY